MGALADVANLLVGSSRDDYKCNQVVNVVLYGPKDVKINGQNMLARAYLTWGVPTTEPDEAVVIVGNDGAHVGIFVSKTEFIHSSYGRNEVVKLPIEMIDTVFRHGHIYRKEH